MYGILPWADINWDCNIFLSCLYGWPSRLCRNKTMESLMDFLTIPRGHCLMDSIWRELLITSNNRPCMDGQLTFKRQFTSIFDILEQLAKDVILKRKARQTVYGIYPVFSHFHLYLIFTYSFYYGSIKSLELVKIAPSPLLLCIILPRHSD